MTGLGMTSALKKSRSLSNNKYKWRSLESEAPSQEKQERKEKARRAQSTRRQRPKAKSLTANTDGSKINLANCGFNRVQVSLDSRIVGGDKVEITTFPWTVSLQKSDKHFCGGSVITDRWILSAAHCLMGVKHSIAKVRAQVGSTQWKSPDASKYEVDQLIIHEKYDSFNYANDIALIKTKEPIEFKSNSDSSYQTNSVCLPGASMSTPETANVYGWGLLGESGSASDDLMKVTLDKTEFENCEKAYKKFVGELQPQMMCYTSPGKDACQGDSGGPLSQQLNRQEFQYGIVSFGLGCSRVENPGIYTNVALYTDWIENTINNN